MIFQWQLFVLLMAVAILVPAFGQRMTTDVYGERHIYYTWLPVLVIALPMIYMAGTRSRTTLSFGDTSAYLNSFREAPTSLSALFASFSDDTKDKGFEAW